MSASARIPRCLAFEQWPQPDQELWAAAEARQQGPFRIGAGRIRVLRTVTIINYRNNYAAWLSYLHEHAGQILAMPPAERLTPELMNAYLAYLIARDHAGLTILDRFKMLRNAVRMMLPNATLAHITRPGGVPISQLIPMTRREKFVPDAAVAQNWAIGLFQDALSLDVPLRRCIQVRDATIIAILLDRAPRRRALSSLHLDKNLQRRGGEWFLMQDADITKTGKHLDLPLSSVTARMLDRYLERERLELLAGQEHDGLWVSARGGRLGARGISRMVALRTRIRFGQAVSPHCFRTMLATMQASSNGDAPFDAWLLLGNTPRVALQYYNRANAMMASRRHCDMLQQLRQRYERRRDREPA